MKFNCSFIVSLILLVFPFQYAASQGLKGRITGSRGEPLPYATIYIREVRFGTATNPDGYYEINLKEGIYSVTYQHLGYKPVEQTIVIKNSVTENNVTLIEQVFEMPEIVIRANEKDRSCYIMRKAIGMAPWHLKQVKSYEAEVYIKGGGRINKIPRILKKQMKADANQTPIEEGKYYYSESVNIISFNSPDKYVHRVVSSQSNIPMDEAASSPMDYIQASFYQPILADVAISPLAPNAFSHYNFKFLGSTLQGENRIDKIQVTPKRKSQQLFTGIICIVENDWSIQSLDLSNDNVMGTIGVKQVYLPVEDKIWMPVRHDFSIDISIMGIKAEASYTSSVKYNNVDRDKTLTAPSGLAALDESAGPEIKEEKDQEKYDQIEEILSKDKITARDMARLSKLNEKRAEPVAKEPLEVKDNTTYIIDKDATKKDSAYWEKARPIPLTTYERVAIPVSSPLDTTMAKSNTLTITIGGSDKKEGKEKSTFSKITGAAIKGKKWDFNKDNSLLFDGIADLKTFSFNTVDGFSAGTGLTWIAKTGKYSRININPSIRYAFNSRDLMWSMNTGINFDPVHQSWIVLRAGSTSRDFASSGVNPFINTISSLVFRYNWMKLYKNDFVNISYGTEIVNGLKVKLTTGWEKRSTLENATNFSFFRPDRDYTSNIPNNSFVNGNVDGFDPFTPVNHNHGFITGEVTYTPRQRYKIHDSVKVNLPSGNPVFHLLWKHGYNYNDTLNGHFDFIKGDITMNRSLGAMKQIRWHLAAGGSLNRKNMQFQDFQIFNTQPSPVLINNYQDAFLLKPYYAIATPSFFGEAHVKYTTPCLIIKRLPLLSQTLMRENLQLSWLWTPEYKHYTEVGYSLSEIFFLGEAGVYASFRNSAFDGAGVRFVLSFN